MIGLASALLTVQSRQVGTPCVPAHGLPVNQNALRVPLMLTKAALFPFSSRKSSI